MFINLQKLLLILVLMVSSIPFSLSHACMEGSMVNITLSDEEIDMPCHGVLKIEKQQTDNQDCQCDNCSCPDYCGSLIVYNLELDNLKSPFFVSLKLLDILNVKIPVKAPNPLIRPPIFS